MFANALAAYASAYALLMNNVSLLPIRLSEQFVSDIIQRPEFGSAIAVIMMVFMVIAIGVQNKMTPKKGGETLMNTEKKETQCRIKDCDYCIYSVSASPTGNDADLLPFSGSGST